MVDQNQDEIRVINYLDIHAQVDNNQVEEFSIEKLQNAFPDIDPRVLKTIESEWRKARNTMLNIQF